MSPVSKGAPLSHYTWGDACEGWNLVAEPGWSVKQERMPPGTAERRHYHQTAQQFFFILNGKAEFEVGEATLTLRAGEGLHIKAGQQHRIANPFSEALEFLLCSQPSAANDRINCSPNTHEP